MISGFICKMFEYPFDTIKVQMGGGRFAGPIDCLRQTISERGAMSLYAGLTAPLIGSIAECASLFASYGYIKKAIGVDEENATLTNPTPM